jgi:hypothetical protein
MVWLICVSNIFFKTETHGIAVRETGVKIPLVKVMPIA